MSIYLNQLGYSFYNFIKRKPHEKDFKVSKNVNKQEYNLQESKIQYNKNNQDSEDDFIDLVESINKILDDENNNNQIIRNKSVSKVENIIFLLDESGSMNPYKNELLLSFDYFFKDQKSIHDNCKFSLFTFSEIIKQKYLNIDLNKMDNISDYFPSGGTSLYDALGNVFETYKHKQNVLLIIITDGWDNCSKKYNKKNILNLLKQNIENYNTNKWNFLYIVNDKQLLKQGMEIGLKNDSNSGISTFITNFQYFSRFVNSYLSPEVKKIRQGKINFIKSDYF